MDAYVCGWSVLVVASSGVDRLVLVDSMGVWQGQGGGMEARLAVLYPLILTHLINILCQYETVNLQSQLLARSP